jgi:hypothetical protein
MSRRSVGFLHQRIDSNAFCFHRNKGNTIPLSVVRSAIGTYNRNELRLKRRQCPSALNSLDTSPDLWRSSVETPD